ncbi:hypothetical protein B4907_19050 [Yersinia kristensenii]|nr:hypothetical protein B4907_19050 [Yersinia kristensenii]
MHTRLALIILLSSQTAAAGYLAPAEAKHYDNPERITFKKTDQGGTITADTCSGGLYSVDYKVGPTRNHNDPGTKTVDGDFCSNGIAWDAWVRSQSGRSVTVYGNFGPGMLYVHSVNTVKSRIYTSYTPIERVIGPTQCTLNAPKNIDLGRHDPDQTSNVTNSATTIKCTGDSNVIIKLPRPSMEFTEGATSQVSIQPSSGIIKVPKNQTIPIPLVFDTTVSSSSEAGEYTQSLVVTAEIQ